MSHFTNIKTNNKFDSKPTIAAALEKMGFAVEVHEEPQALHGYGSAGLSADFAAEVIVRKAKAEQPVRLHADLGFRKAVDDNGSCLGCYEPVLDSDDKGKFSVPDFTKSYFQAHTEAKVAEAAILSNMGAYTAEWVTQDNGDLTYHVQYEKDMLATGAYA